jgi:dedicator of cytokinesis protein 3
MMRSPKGSWTATAASRSHLASPTPDDHQANGTRVTSPQPNGIPVPQDKKRLSLAFLTKSVLMGESDKEKDAKPSEDDNHDASSISTSTRSPSKEVSRHRLSLSFMNHSSTPAPPGSPAPEALPAYQNMSQTSLGRTPSTTKRPATGGSKSLKSESSGGNLKGSMKKRLSFMTLGKKGSKSSVKGKQQDTLVEE